MLRIRTTFLKVISNSWFIALVVSMLIITLLPPIFSKYKSELKEKGLIDKPGGFEYWSDINNDGNSELIVMFNNTQGQASLKIMDQGKFILGQYYFKGKMIPFYESFASGVLDSTGKILLILLTIQNDSVFLNIADPSLPEKNAIREKFIAKIELRNGYHDFSLAPFYISDLDHDSANEVIFSLMAGFPLKPRQLFVFSLKKDQVYATRDQGRFSGISEIKDVNNDGFKEILLSSYAINNYPDSVKSPEGDHSAWLMLMNNKLEYIFAPKEYPGRYVELKNAFVNVRGQPAIALIRNQRTHSLEKPSVSIYGLNGELLTTKEIDDTLRLRYYSLYVDPEKKGFLYLIRENGVIDMMDENLRLNKEFHVNGVQTVTHILVDIDDDHLNELVFTGGSVCPPTLVRSDFSHPVTLPIPIRNATSNFGIICQKDKDNQIFVQIENNYYICSYEINPLFYLRFLLYAGIFIIVSLFIWLIRFIQRKTLEDKYRAEKKIAELQLLLLKNQIDPHFTFNAINAISASVLSNKPEEANDNILRLSKLMRSCVEHSDNLSRSLALELEFVKNYLDLLKSRMDPSFEYFIEIADDVKLEIQVPKMLIQINVENAVKHGLRPLVGNGKLWIRANQAEHNLVLEVEDNGVGRHTASANGSSGTGKGLSIMQQLISSFNRYNPQKIQIEITDLNNASGKACGTKVTIKIPFGMKFQFYEK